MNDYKVIFVWEHKTEDFSGELTVKGASLNECMMIGEAIIAENDLAVIDYYTDNDL